ncbi:hypothetical protein APR41_11975 [Salegentibacter salinarum]|uniref:phosphoribosylglycinamide formyltransferase 1 n=1 Tax=Salegentibacter salinarum TaxID=447422 RepID=A0A2N0U2I5_9FLAO|nr:formyltransferase family protein [Salegentibacter salinarum]PKD21126.1 hypothetical protein APR41_11975 [Salegentibacter salinarum]SKB76243.1 Formyl transferase [Salegentibacter salinarum]
MKIALLTSDNLRHKYIAHCVAKQLDLKLIITEKKSPTITATDSLREEDAEFIKNHFLKRKNSEKDYFGDYTNFPIKSNLLEIDHGSINSKKVKAEIEKAEVDYILLFGTSIIKKELLNKYSGLIINLHLGLSPYYRGSATNLFPFYYKEPECIGGTIHLASTEVDRGDILHQFRPAISKGDTLHDIGNKTIIKGGKLLPKVLEEYSTTKIQIIEQQGEGRLCKIKNLTPEKLRIIYHYIEQGLIEDYLRDKKSRDEAFKIFQQDLQT